MNASKMKQYLENGEACLLDLSIGRIALRNGHYYIEIDYENGNGKMNGKSYKKVNDHDFLVDAMYISCKLVDSPKTFH